MTLVEPTWDEARAAAHAAGDLSGAERVDLAEGDRRVLSEPITAATDLPPFDVSAMDGWAVAGEGPWQVVGEVLAGGLFPSLLRPGEAVAIATGAAVPSGTTAILRTEHARRTSDRRVEGTVAEAADLRRAGEEVRAGQVLAHPGTRLNPAHLGLAAAAGLEHLTVRRRPTARLLVLGDELLFSGPGRDGRVRDSLGPQLPAWLQRLGVATTSVVRVADTLDAHVSAIAAADEDLVVTTGGTAAGPVDHLHRALQLSGGRMLIDTVAVRPGHPMLLGALDGHRRLLGLPGNPQSAVVALLTLGAPMVDAMAGRPLADLELVRLAEDTAGKRVDTRLVLARRSGNDVTPERHVGSGMLRGVAAADGFAVLPPGDAAAGSELRWLPLP